MVSFSLLQIPLSGGSLGCLFDGKFGVSKGQSACGGEEKILAHRGEAKHVCAAVVSYFS